MHQINNDVWSWDDNNDQTIVENKEKNINNYTSTNKEYGKEYEIKKSRNDIVRNTKEQALYITGEHNWRRTRLTQYNEMRFRMKKKK